jgi:hypothetical protein
MRHALLIGVLALVACPVLAGPAAAQAEAPATASDRLEAWLRRLVTAQESYYADHGTYTTDLAALRLLPAVRQDSVWIRVLHAGGRSWTADAGHRSVRGKSCVIYIGALEDFPSVPKTSEAGLGPEEEAIPVCDEL